MDMVALKVAMDTERGGHRVVLTVDETTIEAPPVEHLVYYAGLGVLAAVEIIEWPLGGWCLSPNHPGNLSQMGSFESSEMEIAAYGRSCAEPIFGSPGCHLFNTSHLALLLMAGHALMDATNRPALHEFGEVLEEA
jgi:hypothetical protein